MEFLYKKIKELGLENIYTYVMDKNPSKYAPYHNNFHLENVCKFSLMNAEENNVDIRSQQILATAALFHDFDHSAGGEKDDSVNIERAIKGFQKYISEFDNSIFTNSYCVNDNIIAFDVFEYNIILKLIRATRYPYLTESVELTFNSEDFSKKYADMIMRNPPSLEIGNMLRDADILQGLYCQNYINGVTRAIATEAGIPYENMLKGQINFIKNTKYLTEWAVKKANDRIPYVLILVENAIENHKNY
jgi:hypothetical protein